MGVVDVGEVLDRPEALQDPGHAGRKPEPEGERILRRGAPMRHTGPIRGGEHRFHAVLLAAMAAALALTMALLQLLLWSARRVLGEPMRRFDERALEAAAALRSPLWDRIALDVTALANTLTMIVLLAVAALLLWQTRHRASAALLVLAAGGGFLANRVMKHVFDRARPELVEWGVQVASPSFPSGHAMAATVAYGALAYVAGRLEPGRAVAVLTWSLAALLVLAVAGSRVYLGVHYPSDVAGGVVAGAVWLAAVVGGVRVARRAAGRE